MKFTITAFEPFGGFNTNSSLEILKRINYQNINKIILPVSYPDAYNVLKESIKNSDFIILLGMAVKRNKVSIEERARNILQFKIPDNNGKTITNQLIQENEPEYLYSSVNIDPMINYLKQYDEGIYKSNDAGTYICNYLYFKVLQEIKIPSIFIHLPEYETNKEFEQLDFLLNKIIKYIEKSL